MDQTPDRVGLYIKPETRNRLNLFKAELTLAMGQVMSQDDAINHLLDLQRTGDALLSVPESERTHAMA